uniref:Uncharacterized protein n=1 Tax=Anguilla anguilla TaxID=7936 RepID=A0A0E9Q9Q6_ANGAN
MTFIIYLFCQYLTNNFHVITVSLQSGCF